MLMDGFGDKMVYWQSLCFHHKENVSKVIFSQLDGAGRAAVDGVDDLVVFVEIA